ncbi:RNA polymerase sigma factor [Sutcliffiella cohnii]
MFTERDVKKAIKGNKKAFAMIMEAEKAKIYQLAYLYVKNENDAVEIVQETVYKAFVSIHTLKNPSYLYAWLKKIAINSALDFIAQQSKVTPIHAEIIEAMEAAKEVAVESRLDLFHAIDQLDEKYKTIIILKYYEDLPNKVRKRNRNSKGLRDTYIALQ